MAAPSKPTAETDPRFPSGPWTGFFLQKLVPGRHMMEMSLHFADGTIVGAGRDRVGEFVIEGSYELKDGSCQWRKQYVGKHNVYYRGFNEGKGIWGLWEIPPSSKGGFHIWPEGMSDPTTPHMAEAIDAPAEAPAVPELAPELEVGVGVGVGVAEPEPVGASADPQHPGRG